MDFSDAIPVEAIKAKVGHFTPHVVATNVKQWRKNRAKDVNNTLMSIWDEMVHRGKVREPMAISPIVQDDFKGIYEFVGAYLAAAPIRSAYAIELFDSFRPDYAFTEVSLVHCLPNAIHIADVEFSDTRRSVGGQYRGFRGLGVFNEFIDRLKQVGRDKDAERITLVVAYPPLHDVFVSHGFQLNDTEVSRFGFERSGHGHSMFIDL
ncbi:hypothetical protein CO659_22815 [Rhizobium sp. S9]|uniref:hypothetical protein n=1 Tax=Rhizobium sp. S9 TaxID=2035454 RepID=UPI000BE8A4BE|nr:hypothetical protein [Rhizobium sp. S9]PDS95477.1 hypothetical protein CO659_22815 [Rhizobium sp. S9]